MSEHVVRILLVEDDRTDAELIRGQFEQEGVPLLLRRVAERDAFEAALATEQIDAIISDYSIPGFDGMTALKLARERRPDVPFIFCSGAMGEELAVEMLRQGAVDYVIKDRIARIVPAVRRALAEREEREQRLEAEAALHESEERYRRLFHDSTDTVVLHEIGTADQPGPIIEINDAGLRMFGYTFAELERIGLEGLQAPGQSHELARLREQLLRGEDLSFERSVVAKSGRHSSVEIRSRMLMWHGRNVVMSVVRDITERVQTGTAMHLLSTDLARVTGERFFRELLARLAPLLEVEVAFIGRAHGGAPPSGGLLALWIDGRQIEANERPALNLVCPAKADDEPCMFPDGLPEEATHISFLREQHIRSAVVVPLQDTAGHRLGQIGVMSRQPMAHPDRVLAILQLFAVRTAAELERQRSERQFAELFEFAPDAMLMLDREGSIVLVNRQAERLFGWPRAELTGRTIDVLADSDGDGSHARALREHLLRADPSRGGAQSGLRARCKDGAVIPIDVRTSPMESESAALVVAAFRDMTPFKEAERRMLRAQRLESLGTLAGGIAHDLNNVLTPILGGAELVQSRVGPTERAIVESIAASARRGANMVRQLLTFARGAESGRRGPVEPAGLLRELERIIQNTFPKNVHQLIECAPDIASIEADSTQIHQVLLNLCVNARDAMPAGGTLRITAVNATIDETFAATQPEAHPGSYVALSVTDSGSGISPEVFDRIFEPFFTTKDPSVGTGLGLSTALGIARSHGGFIQIRSELRRGSTFTVFIPATQRGAAAGPVAASAPFEGHGETILITDDEPLVRQTMKASLERLGFAVVEAVDGTGALVTAAQLGDRVRAVVTDVNMPHMDGVTLVRALRRILPKVCIIAASGRHEATKSAIFRSLGVRTFLDKPYTLQQLLEALREGLTG